MQPRSFRCAGQAHPPLVSAGRTCLWRTACVPACPSSNPVTTHNPRSMTSSACSHLTPAPPCAACAMRPSLAGPGSTSPTTASQVQLPQAQEGRAQAQGQQHHGQAVAIGRWRCPVSACLGVTWRWWHPGGACRWVQIFSGMEWGASLGQSQAMPVSGATMAPLCVANVAHTACRWYLT